MSDAYLEGAIRCAEPTVTSETQQPTNAPGWVDHWERGLDPRHVDAFVGTVAEGRFENTGKRSTGWEAIDWVGNVVGFVPDGTPVERFEPLCLTE